MTYEEIRTILPEKWQERYENLYIAIRGIYRPDLNTGHLLVCALEDLAAALQSNKEIASANAKLSLEVVGPLQHDRQKLLYVVDYLAVSIIEDGMCDNTMLAAKKAAEFVASMRPEPDDAKGNK